MFLAEPPTTKGDLHFSLLGYPVRIHPYFWLMAAMMGGLDQPAIYCVLWVAAVLVCILLHELGHAVVMKFYGYYPSIVLYSFGGLAIPHRGAYSVRQPGPWGDMLIAFAGPASGFILAAVLALGLRYVGGYDVTIFEPTWRQFVPTVSIPNHEFLHEFLGNVFYITVWWGLVNLLPIYPLDGGQIAQQVFYLNNPQDAIRPALILSVVVGGLVTGYLVMQMNMKDGMDWRQLYLPAFFGFLTYSNYARLQSHQIRGGW